VGDTDNRMILLSLRAPHLRARWRRGGGNARSCTRAAFVAVPQGWEASGQPRRFITISDRWPIPLASAAAGAGLALSVIMREPNLRETAP
jgi:hypothetical protein